MTGSDARSSFGYFFSNLCPHKKIQASRMTFRCERFGMNLGVYSEIQLFKKFYERKIFENFRVDVFE